MNSFRWYPDQGTEYAEQVDTLYLFLLAVSVFFLVLIGTLIVRFVVHYRHDSDTNRSGARVTSWPLEITWTLIPLGLTIVMFMWGAQLYFDEHRPPENATQVNVVAKPWIWKLQHPSGKAEINSLHVPLGEPVQLRMISEDVIHSFYIPAFRTKQDVLPGRYTSLWFTANKPGTYHLFCAEYCGTDHSKMIGSVIVQSPSEYDQWQKGGEFVSAAARGEALFQQFRCDSCHSPGSNGRGPNLADLFGKKVPLSDGTTAVVDERYVRQSILDPAQQIVAGYLNVMPTYEGQITEEDVLNLIAYLRAYPQASANQEEAQR